MNFDCRGDLNRFISYTVVVHSIGEGILAIWQIFQESTGHPFGIGQHSLHILAHFALAELGNHIFQSLIAALVGCDLCPQVAGAFFGRADVRQ